MTRSKARELEEELNKARQLITTYNHNLACNQTLIEKCFSLTWS